jgi:hypothetical protein
MCRWGWLDAAPVSDQCLHASPMVVTCPRSNIERRSSTVTDQVSTQSKLASDAQVKRPDAAPCGVQSFLESSESAFFLWPDASGQGQPDMPGVRSAHHTVLVFLNCWRHHVNWWWTVNRRRPISSVCTPSTNDRMHKCIVALRPVRNPSLTRLCVARPTLTGRWRQCPVIVSQQKNTSATSPPSQPLLKCANHQIYHLVHVC